ncbi:uncharacterized protein KGF55_000921 [Candida pseudojiufengensis]|uniref:uncharacterized protein n=1 Tax=Candida pseudojiufengensis TaxID=497109 RepID=UPI0022242B7D|nr:uncharacterized protein KGF55_000921 [Candida pseudojiufengensis]KAI5965559.1 hypothetical protein KGF55_000921 [Candida pseudojiufengensis]
MALRKKKEGKHIKHSPNINIQSETQFNSTFLVKSSTPYVSALKKIDKILTKFNKSKNQHQNSNSSSNKKFQNENYKKLKYITVKGMGKTIEKTLKIAMNFKFELNYKVDIITGSIQVLDEFEKKSEPMSIEEKNAIAFSIANEDDDKDNDDEPEREYQKRMVSYVEARIWLKRE